MTSNIISEVDALTYVILNKTEKHKLYGASVSTTKHIML